MKCLWLVVFCLFNVISLSVSADLQKGVWRGRINESADCYIEVKDTTYENNVVSAVSERVLVVIGSHDFSAHHPRVINVDHGDVSVNLNVYESLLLEQESLFAMSLEVQRQNQVVTPSKLTIFEQGYDGSLGEKLMCDSFVKTAD